MKTFQFLKTIAGILLAVVLVSTSSTAFAQFSPVMQECPTWSVEFLGKVYDRPTDDLGLPLVTNTVTNATVFDSDEATDLNGGVGAEVRFNFKDRRSNNWEIRTFIVDFEEDASVTGTNLFSPLFPTIAPDTVFTNYQSEIFSIGLSTKRNVRPGLTFLFGPRFYSMRENYEAGFNQLITSPLGSFNLIGSQTNRVRNSMYGLQAGLEINMPIIDRFYAQAYGRFGGYVNPVELTITQTTNLPGSTATTTEFNSTGGAFIGEVGGRVYYDILPNMFSCFVGYEATWIDGAAVAPAQFLSVGTPTAPTIDTTNTPFFHALTFGLNYKY